MIEIWDFNIVLSSLLEMLSLQKKKNANGMEMPKLQK